MLSSHPVTSWSKPAMRGRLRKSNAQKIFEGNLGNRPITGEDFVPEVGVPEMPKGLSFLARREWRQITRLLLERGTLSRLDGKALAAYCEAYARAEAASKLIDKFGLMVPILKLENGKLVATSELRPNPAVSIHKDYLMVQAKYLDMFGLSPKSRVSLNLTDKPKRCSPLVALMEDAPVVGFLH